MNNLTGQTPLEVRHVMAILELNGYESRVVGGAVRDLLGLDITNDVIAKYL